jgi:hypothetical protein
VTAVSTTVAEFSRRAATDPMYRHLMVPAAFGADTLDIRFFPIFPNIFAIADNFSIYSGLKLTGMR